MARMFPGMSFWQYKAIKDREEKLEAERKNKKQEDVR